jgi:hypothetical protein
MLIAIAPQGHAMQTPTPHPQAYRLPRACASRPARGPLDDHFLPLPPRLQRSTSLPSGMDSCTRRQDASPRHPSKTTATSQTTPGFVEQDPYPAAAGWKAVPDVSTDFQILNGAATHTSSSERDVSNATTSSTHATRFLTPRLGTLAVSACAPPTAPQLGTDVCTPGPAVLSEQAASVADQVRHAKDADMAQSEDDTNAASQPADIDTSVPFGWSSSSRPTPAASAAPNTPVDNVAASAIGVVAPLSLSLQDVPHMLKPSTSMTTLALDGLSARPAHARSVPDAGAAASQSLPHEVAPQSKQRLAGSGLGGGTGATAQRYGTTQRHASAPMQATEGRARSEEHAVKRHKRTPLAPRNINTMRGGVQAGGPMEKIMKTKGRTGHGLGSASSPARSMRP